MGALFGLPVSGLLIPQHPILVSTTGAPLWLTGGSYGPEGGAAATAVVTISILVIWRARWLSVSPEMAVAWTAPALPEDTAVSLNLQNEKG